MARIRTIKPSFFTSLTITALPLSTRLTFAGLWTYADDEGRAVDDPRLVKAEIWPLDDDMTPKKVGNELSRLAEVGLIHRYEVQGRRYIQIVGWAEHQRVNRPTPSKHPLPFTEDSLSPHGEITADSVTGPGALTEDSRPEGKGRERKGTGNPPTPASGGPASHSGQHPNCRACGTNPRGTTTPTGPRYLPDGSLVIPGSGAVTHVQPAPQPDWDANRQAIAALKATRTPEAS